LGLNGGEEEHRSVGQVKELTWNAGVYGGLRKAPKEIVGQGVEFRKRQTGG